MHKKLIAALLLVCSISGFAEGVEEPPATEKSDLYFGIDLFQSKLSYEFENTTLNTSNEFDTSSKGVRLKFGAISDNNWRVQGSFSVENMDDNVFSVNDTDGNLYEIGVDVIKGFEVSSDFAPFVLVGVNRGWMSVSGYNVSTIDSLALKAGAGVLYSINETLELTAGVDFKFRLWSEIEFAGQKIEPRDTSITPYIGLNVH